MSFENLFDLGGKRALVTGAASGIGEAIARTFAAQKAHVVLADVNAQLLQKVASDLGSAAECHVFDQSDLSSVEAMAAAAGDVDILINNAGIALRAPLLELNWMELRQLIDTNLVGPIALTRLVGEGMVARRSGNIINISSQLMFNGARHRAVYASTKAAISQFTKTAAMEWGPEGIRVNCIAPGRTLTPINTWLLNDPVEFEQGLQRIPLRRYGDPQDIANTALFLASPASGYITGETIIVDGGWILE